MVEIMVAYWNFIKKYNRLNLKCNITVQFDFTLQKFFVEHFSLNLKVKLKLKTILKYFDQCDNFKNQFQGRGQIFQLQCTA